MDDRSLLREYAEHGSEAAFTELVRRHLNLVYGVCLRELRDPGLAEDATQVVFLLLARKASGLRPGVVLVGWLYQTARLTARNARRQETRRRTREAKIGSEWTRMQETPTVEPAWEELEPHLHEALSSLKAAEREALLLRYFEGCSLKETGAVLGISETGAHMRISRALEKLRGFFQRRGVLLPTTVLASLLGAKAALSADTMLSAERCAEVALARVPVGGPVPLQVYELTEGVLREMKLLLLKKVALGACALLLAGGGSVVTAQAFQAAPAAQDAATVPSASELLRRFGETQAGLQSFIIRCGDGLTEEATRTVNSEYRVDALTGRFTSRLTLPDGAYNSQLWDGKEFYSYSAGPNRPGSVSLDRTGALHQTAGYLRQLRTGFGGAASMGYFWDDEQRVDQLLKGSRSLRVRPKLEPVGESDCFVVEGTAPTGKYTLWLDPQHGYHLARAEMVKGAGNLVFGRPLPGGAEVRDMLEEVRFEKVAGVWVPMSCRRQFRELFPARSDQPTAWTMYHRKHFVLLNPNFDAPELFRPDDLREGARVYRFGEGNKKQPDYLWRNGNLEPFAG